MLGPWLALPSVTSLGSRGGSEQPLNILLWPHPLAHVSAKPTLPPPEWLSSPLIGRVAADCSGVSHRQAWGGGRPLTARAGGTEQTQKGAAWFLLKISPGGSCFLGCVCGCLWCACVCVGCVRALCGECVRCGVPNPGTSPVKAHRENEREPSTLQLTAALRKDD